MLTLLASSSSPETRARASVDDVPRTPGPSGHDGEGAGEGCAREGASEDRLERGDADDVTVMRTSYVVDGDGGSWSTQSVRMATLVHDGGCGMRVRERGGGQGETRERRARARVRVMVGPSAGEGARGGELGEDGGGSGSRMLRVHVSCDDDPFFYHAMEVREEDYGRLRAEQRLVVNFDEFPRALVRLIQACDRASSGSDSSKDVYCVLDVTHAGDGTSGGSSTLSIVETNEFNQFTHVALKFKPASDRAAKRILAGLLLDARDRERELRRFEKLYRDSQDALELARAKSLEAQMKYAESSATGKREILDELERARERFEAEKRDLRKRVDETLREKSDLEREKFSAQNKVSELGTKLGLLEGELSITKRELQRVREENAALDAEVHERDKAHSSRALRVEWLEKQLEDKDEVVQLLKSRLDASEEHKVALASSWEQSRRALGKAEERLAASAAEITKGNEIIENLQRECRAAKSKTKIQAAVIKRQEALLQERLVNVESAASDAAERSFETRELEEKLRVLTAEKTELTTRLAESHALLQSNQQVIEWLNRELNEAALGRAPSRAVAPAREAPRSPLIDLSSPVPGK